MINSMDIATDAPKITPTEDNSTFVYLLGVVFNKYTLVFAILTVMAGIIAFVLGIAK